MLEVKNLSVHYGHIHALKGVSLDIAPGEIATLIGSNGAGKTTLLNAISGLVKISGGSILYEGKPVPLDRPDAIVRMGIVHCPEGRKVFADLTVAENIMAGAFTRRGDPAVRRDADALMERFPRLAERRRQVAGTLSGGEQQMLAICRSLMAKPRILLLDEPSMGLSPTLVREVFSIIRQLNEEGITILLVEQNAFQALRTARSAYVIESGNIVRAGAASELLANDDVRRAYLG
jgi:branched-chain amino acid transport system ATP-binding protein